MGHRLTKIYTRTGDDGTTALADGARVDKNSLRITAIGDIDELNSVIGMVLAQRLDDKVQGFLAEIQHDLFNLGAELSLPHRQLLNGSTTTRLERIIDGYNQSLPPLKEFILPGGNRAVSTCHLARAVCRRAERSLVALANTEAVSQEVLQYINRLSDMLFVLCRVIARDSGSVEVYWNSPRIKGET